MSTLQEPQLDSSCHIQTGMLPERIELSVAKFDLLWSEHPEAYHQIRIHGREVETPRWQQAYGVDYHYTGRTNNALPLLPALVPLLKWAQAEIDNRLNGALLNWYEGSLGHYIGKHRDSTRHMQEGAPIVTISLGEQRVFRMRPWKGKSYRDFPVANNSVLVIPYQTNQRWTHEVPHFAKYVGRRISVTLRAFRTESR